MIVCSIYYVWLEVASDDSTNIPDAWWLSGWKTFALPVGLELSGSLPDPLGLWLPQVVSKAPHCQGWQAGPTLVLKLLQRWG